MTENALSQADLLDWMQHSIQLTRSCIREIRKRMSEDRAHPEDANDLMRYEDELAVTTFCLANREKAEQFQGVAAAWWAYMVAHAELQVARYGNAISEDEFHQACRAIRRVREQDLKKSVGVAWVAPAQKEKIG